MKDWKYIRINLGGERFDFIYDVKLDKVYPKLFPGIEVEPFNLRCGLRIKPEILKKIVIDKIVLLEAEMQLALEQQLDYEKLF